jgi:hypothetical protein
VLSGESHFSRLAEITLRSPIDFAEAVAQLVHLASIEVSIDWAEHHQRATAEEISAVQRRLRTLRLSAFLRVLECLNDSGPDIRH